MSTPTTNNADAACTPPERKLLDQVRALSPTAVQHLEQYLSFLECRDANETEGDAEDRARAQRLLTNPAFLATLQRLPPALGQLVVEYAMFVAGTALQWSYGDPASLDRATEFMALDPFFQKEMEAINRDFAPAEGDGLEDH